MTTPTFRRGLAAVGTVLTLSLTLAGCAGDATSSQPAETTRAANDAFPVTIEVPGVEEPLVLDEQPARIAVLSPDAAIALHQLGVTDRIIAVPESAQNPTLNPYAEAMADIEHTVGGHNNPEPELVLSWQPDLVVVTARHTGEQDAAELLTSTGVPVLTLTNRWLSSEAVLENLDLLGQATGTGDQAQTLTTEISEGLAETRTSAAEAESTPSVAVLSNQAHSPFINAAPSLVTEMVSNGGGHNAADDLSITTTMPVQPEQLVAMNPDYIMLVDVTGKGAESFDELLGNPAVAGLPAVQEERVRVFPGREMYGLAGREVVAASDSVLAWLHPELAK